MNSNSRTKNSILTIVGNNITQIFTILARFLDRTIFIYCLGKDYLGLNGLFTSILSVLSLTELGIGTAIVFYMYTPIAENDIKKLKVYVSFYKKCYIAVGSIIFIIGLGLVPFLSELVNFDADVNINIYVIYVMYLLNTCCSYWFFSYVQTVIIAHQKQYLLAKYDIGFIAFNSIISGIVLYIFKNYYYYYIVQISVTLIKGFTIRFRCFKLYPWLKDKCLEKLERTEKKRLYTDIYSIMLTKISSTMGNSFDNMIVSSFVSTTMVGVISNYIMVQTAITNLIHQMINSFSASVGNLVTEGDTEKELKIFNQLDMINYYCMYFTTVCLSALLPYFVKIWLGNGFELPMSVLLCITINNYICNTLYATWVFKDAKGLFVYGRYIQLVSGFANLALSILLAKMFGIVGVYFASLATNLVIAVPPFTHYLYKYGFKKSASKKLRENGYRLIVTIVTSALLIFLCERVSGNGVLSFIVRIVMCVVVSNIIFIFINLRNQSFKEVLYKTIRLIRNIFGNYFLQKVKR
ncbi:MAG: lipopolysaccharide biosynthesis protein [Faecalibacterium sp.]